ncbi:hypothetical protein DENIS_2314 [Desulfonema ishimotonii]|uniref:DNA circulation N-terminal domain-containing protein n=1 Tax=Desulfonema ishimotonii TaxID=45657 RepID=A0A401FWP5_9BACT|nr:hypothetical protein [Desulfonema ishimotonii]GBC61354.1 hypothetical protein DENIS_2314 [Desulfonema ishimotonii]
MTAKVSLAKIDLPGARNVVCHEARKLVEHKIPGMRGSFFQDMGGQPVRIEVAGSVFGDEARSGFLTSVREKYLAAEPVIFVADALEGTEVQEVLIRDFRVYESADDHNVLNYQISLDEYVPPPDESGLGAVEDATALEGGDRFDALVDDVAADLPVDQGLMDQTLGDFSDAFSEMELDDLLENIPAELLDQLEGLLGIGYEDPVEVWEDLSDTVTDGELDTGAVVAGSAQIAAKLVLTLLTADADKKSEWTQVADFFKKIIT